MKKNMVFLIFVFIPVLSSFGLDFSLSAGAGGLLGMDITRYTLDATGNGKNYTLTQHITQINYGGVLFFDATWAEFSLIFQGGYNTYSEVLTASDGSQSSPKGTGTEAMLGFSLLGKYPFKLSEGFTIFPLLGIQYWVALMEYRTPDNGTKYDRTGPNALAWADVDKDGKSRTMSMWNALWIDLGVGLDYALNSSLYLRGELLYGFRLQTPYETDSVDQSIKLTGDSDPSMGGLTSGPTFKIALGYKFFS